MEPFKNMLSAQVARGIGEAVVRGAPVFDLKRFMRGLKAELEPLELKARMQCIADRLEAGLPQAPKKLFPVLVKALKQDAADTVGLDGFRVWPLTEIVARRGLDNFDLAMATLREMTIRFTGEFAIRPFLLKEPDRTLRQLMLWTEDDNEHVRRLASEGSRPLLPWGERLPLFVANPEMTLPILDRLHADGSEYVRRSVANHLNDYSKRHPEFVIETLIRWKDVGHGEFERVAARAARTLVKEGNPEALEIFGYRSHAKLKVVGFELKRAKIGIGDKLEYSIVIENKDKEEKAVLFDYAIYYMKANGTLGRKVFKGRKGRIAAKGKWTVEGGHSFKPVTTRRYYIGEHRMEVLVNGKSSGVLGFELGGVR